MLRKVCKNCLKDLPLSSFTPTKKRYKFGVLSNCKPCMNRLRPSRVGCQNSIEYSRKYRQENPEKVSKTKSNRVDDWWSRNREKHNAKNRKWCRDNPDYNRAKTAKRRAKKLQATPEWLTQDHYNLIRDIYAHAKDCELVSGEAYHVDHIVPLQGENVCGLHVPWNLQVLPSDINLSKSNKH